MFDFLQRFFVHLFMFIAAFFHPAPAHVEHPVPAHVEVRDMRLALVIGNAHYGRPLATAANDAALVAQTLQDAGFEVTAGADLGLDAMRDAFRDFVAKARTAGPNSVIFVYLAGRGAQYAGENFFLPVGAVITRDADIPVAALRVADYTRALAALPVKARIFVLDAAYASDLQGGELAGGLAFIDAEPGSLYAFNAAPGTIAPDEQGPYGIYARALVQMMRQGLSVNDIFARTRLRVNELTRGGVVPWDDSRIDVPLTFFAPPREALPSLPNYASQPLTSFSAAEAYQVAVARDTMGGYQDFLATFPHDPLAPRVRALLAARREALSWRRACMADTPRAYWSYMRRYPRGPHYWDARRRLAILRAALEPPEHFEAYNFGGLPPPEEDERRFVDRPYVRFDEGFTPLTFAPVFLLRGLAGELRPPPYPPAPPPRGHARPIMAGPPQHAPEGRPAGEPPRHPHFPGRPEGPAAQPEHGAPGAGHPGPEGEHGWPHSGGNGKLPDHPNHPDWPPASKPAPQPATPAGKPSGHPGPEQGPAPKPAPHPDRAPTDKPIAHPGLGPGPAPKPGLPPGPPPKPEPHPVPTPAGKLGGHPGPAPGPAPRPEPHSGPAPTGTPVGHPGPGAGPAPKAEQHPMPTPASKLPSHPGPAPGPAPRPEPHPGPAPVSKLPAHPNPAPASKPVPSPPSASNPVAHPLPPAATPAVRKPGTGHPALMPAKQNEKEKK